jgi:hypothetical protein
MIAPSVRRARAGQGRFVVARNRRAARTVARGRRGMTAGVRVAEERQAGRVFHRAPHPCCRHEPFPGASHRGGGNSPCLSKTQQN